MLCLFSCLVIYPMLRFGLVKGNKTSTQSEVAEMLGRSISWVRQREKLIRTKLMDYLMNKSKDKI